MTNDEEIRKIIKDGFQMDYNEIDKLVDVFKNEEVVDNLLFYFFEINKKDAIDFLIECTGDMFDRNTANRLYTEFLNRKQNESIL